MSVSVQPGTTVATAVGWVASPRAMELQNSINAGDNSLVGGLVSAATLVALNYGVGYATFRSKRLETLVEGRPEIIIHNGKIFEDVMRRAQLTHHELQAALRREGCLCTDDVLAAVLENNGTISVVPRRNAEGAASR